ncbi:MAG TPA: MlaD family protein [Bryobacteraceae bacterium]|jgi:phospholipid/cholesterol/gamma-HCH transport system substrate-binding protein
MAIQNKASWARLKVGIMALAALIILAVLVFLLTGETTLFQTKGSLVTYMDDSAAMTEGSPVRLNGILVGKVEKISLSGLTQPRRIVRIDMQVASKWFDSIPVDSIVSIGAENVLGAKYINIKKGTAKDVVRSGSELASLDTREFDDVVQQGYSLLESLKGILKRVDAIVATVEVGKGSIGKLLVDEELYDKVMSITNEVDSMVKQLNSGEGTMGKLLHDDKLYGDVRGSIARLDSLMQGLQEGKGTAGKLLKDPAVYDETHAAIKDVRKLLAGLDKGEGTAGKLLKSDELHDKIVLTINKLNVMLDKVNSGQGTIGQLLVNQQLYDNLNGATREMHGLMKDFRSNPKKFLRIQLKLF